MGVHDSVRLRERVVSMKKFTLGRFIFFMSLFAAIVTAGAMLIMWFTRWNRKTRIIEACFDDDAPELDTCEFVEEQ